MGKRRYGFLTGMQWDYVRGNLPPMSKTRQRIEDYYIMKSIETTLKQMQNTKDWLWKKENQLLYFDENDVKAIEQSFQALRGKRIKKSHKFRFNGIECPHCFKTFDAKVAVDKGEAKWQITTYCPNHSEMKRE